MDIERGCKDKERSGGRRNSIYLQKNEHTYLREVTVTKERNRWDLLRPQFEEVNALL